MIDLVNTMSSMGKESLSLLWFPMVIWTLFAFALLYFLRNRENIPSSYHFHSRVALLIALPLGIIGSSAVNWWSSLSGGSIPAGMKFLVIQNPITVSPAEATAGAASISWGDPFLWVGFLLAILMVGSTIALGYLLWNLRQLYEMSRQLHFRPIHQMLDKAIPAIGNANIEIAFSNEASVPFTYGWLQTKIVLPASLRKNPQELKLALKHELMHVKHQDFLTNSILSLIRCMFWFHPLIHHLHNDCKEYREITCDSEVLADNEVSKKEYARLLYRLATQSNSNNQAIISMAVNSSTLKKRIKMMNKQTNTMLSNKRSILFMMLSAFLIVGVMSCSDLQNENNNNEPGAVETVPSEQSPEPSKSDDGDFYVAVEEMPELKGGLAGLQEDMRYPEEASENGLEGRVIIQFIVNEQGQVENPQVIKGVSESLDEEALRVVQQAEFTPGKQDGQPVRVQYSMPITFRL